MNQRTRQYMIARIADETGVQWLEVTHQAHEAKSGGIMTFDEALAMIYGALFLEVKPDVLPGILEGETYNHLKVTFMASEILDDDKVAAIAAERGQS